MTSNEESTEEMVKVLLMDFDNTLMEENLAPNQEAELKIWKSILKTDEYWKTLIDLQYDEELARKYFENANTEARKAYFTFGVACLISFVQANFTGPELSKEFIEYFETEMLKKADFTKFLNVGLEEVNINTKLPCLLTAAKIIFKNCKFSPLVNVWWTWRSIIIHQQVLDDLCPALLAEATKLLPDIVNLDLEGNFL